MNHTRDRASTDIGLPAAKATHASTQLPRSGQRLPLQSGDSGVSILRIGILLASVLLFGLLLTACGGSGTTPDPTNPTPPTAGTGNLQVTVEGLPEGSEAAVSVMGPEDYSVTVTESQTLENLRTGSYLLEVGAVSFQGLSYSGLFEATEQAELNVDVVESETTQVEVVYTQDPVDGTIAPGVTRDGVVAESAFDDYSFEGIENVPLSFDFDGTQEAQTGRYSVALYRADDLEEALFSSRSFGAFGQPPIFGFAPPQDGQYVLRVRGEQGVADYRVTMTYLSGSPEERGEPTVLSYGDEGEGTVTLGSYDEYRFTGSFNVPVLLSFEMPQRDPRYIGRYQVVFYRVGEEEPLKTSPVYSVYAAPPEVDFTPPEDGAYLVRVVGAGDVETSLVRYSFGFDRLE